MNLRNFEEGHAFSPALAIICMYLILSPVWMPGIAPRLYDDARYVELAALALLLTTLVVSTVRNAVTVAWISLGRIAQVLLLALIAGGALSAALSRADHLGSLEVALVVQLVMLILVTSAAVRAHTDQADKLLSIAVFAGAALCVLKFWVIYLIFAVEGKAFTWDSPFIDFANVRFFSQYQAYTLLLVILPASTQQLGKYARWLVFFVAANFWALHWMVGTRAAWIGLFVGASVAAVFARQRRRQWLREQSLIALAGGAIFLAHSVIVEMLPNLVPVPGIQSMVDRGPDSINERMDLAQDAFRFMMQDPLIGVGPGQFGLQDYPTYAAHPHNVPLQLLSEYGIPVGLAGVALVLTLALFAVKSLRTASGQSSYLHVTLVSALAMGLVDSLFSGNLIMPHSQMLFAVLAGWIIGRTGQAPSGVYEKSAAFRNQRFAIVSVSMLAASVTIILGLEYLPLARYLPMWLPTWNPHFWQYGRFSAW